MEPRLNEKNFWAQKIGPNASRWKQFCGEGGAWEEFEKEVGLSHKWTSKQLMDDRRNTLSWYSCGASRRTLQQTVGSDYTCVD